MLVKNGPVMSSLLVMALSTAPSHSISRPPAANYMWTTSTGVLGRCFRNAPYR